MRHEHIALLGVGALGSAVAGTIRDADFELALYDTAPQRAEAVSLAVGARAVAAPADLAHASIAVCLLPDTSAVRAAVTGRNGLLSTLEPGSLILDMGSSDPAATVALAREAASAGIDYADAPVSGGVSRARSADLTIMFGGPNSVLQRARPLLDAIGSTVIPVGEVGTAHAMKALNNLLSAIGLLGALEVIEVGRRFGLDPQTMLDVLNRSTGRNNSTENKVAQFILPETYEAGFALRLMLKDVATAVALGSQVGASTPLSQACLDLWSSAAKQLPADADHTEIGALVLTKEAM